MEEEDIIAKATEAVINDYNDLRHPKVIIKGEEIELFDSDGDEEEFCKQLDAVFENLDQESDILLDDIKNTKEILYKLRSDAKDINDKIKKTQIQFDQKVKILDDQYDLETLNKNIERFDEIESKFNSNKEHLGGILDKSIKTYPAESSQNYMNLRHNFNVYRKKIKKIKQNIIELYDEDKNIAEKEIDNTLQRIKENQNFNLKTIKDKSGSCNIV